jgi:AbrB family looped-hinge helix DNA binding protein
MQTVRVSPKFQVVIPKELRERLKLRPGQDMAIYEIDGQIRLKVSHRPKSLRSMARGLQWKESDRDHAERL